MEVLQVSCCSWLVCRELPHTGNTAYGLMSTISRFSQKCLDIGYCTKHSNTSYKDPILPAYEMTLCSMSDVCLQCVLVLMVSGPEH